jgi:bacterioferritin-associated ferredoxin
MNAWQEYKKKLGTTRPWDLINPNVERASEELAQQRYSICKECPEFIGLTTQCKQCGCLMKSKVKLKPATCPLDKW